MTESVPSTKKLKSMLKMLREHGVSKYKDGEVEIEFSGIVPMSLALEKEQVSGFSIDSYSEQPTVRIDDEPRDSLGMTDEDYLHWSAGGTR